MTADHIRYDILAQDALRGLVRKVLIDAAKNGLPGEHHFFISFDTHADGVRLSSRMRAQYPDEMTIVLQHQFWDLKVSEEGFEVGLSFGGVAEKLAVPFAAIVNFADPSAQFALQFETIAEADDEEAPEQTQVSSKVRSKPQVVANSAVAKSADAKSAGAKPTESKPVTAKKPALPAVEPAAIEPPGEPPRPTEGGGAEVVRLDRFRKK